MYDLDLYDSAITIFSACLTLETKNKGHKLFVTDADPAILIGVTLAK